MKTVSLRILAALLVTSVAACKGSSVTDGGSGSSGGSTGSGPVEVVPAAVDLSYSDTQTFTASGGSGVGFIWTINPNCSAASIDQTGLYTAGPLDGTDTVIATDSLGNSGTAQVVVGNGGDRRGVRIDHGVHGVDRDVGDHGIHRSPGCVDGPGLHQRR